MSIIQVKDLTFSYGTDLIFDHVSLNLDTSWKLGLIGRNGKGKTTFLKLLLREFDYQGTIFSKEEFSYFPYQVEQKEDLVINIADNICPNVYEWQIIQEFSKLKLKEEVLYQPFNTLSNGEQTKVLIALMFLNEDRFLLLDEPTNYLDIEGKKLICEYLKGKQGFILVSHDRYLLDQVVDHILAINRSTIEVVQGNFSSWYHNKQLKDHYELEKNLKIKKEMKRLNDSKNEKVIWSNIVEKSKIGSKGDKGYIGHKAAKMMQLSKNIERRQENLISEKKKLLQDIEETESLKMQSLESNYQSLFTLEDVSIFNDHKKIIDSISFQIQPHDRIWLRGNNGSGKSSILKLIVGDFHLKYCGKINGHDHLKISYIPEDTSFLKGTLQNFIDEYEINESLFKTILRKLDFKREYFEMRLDEYSEGMKKKVLIAKSLSEEAHLYVWDEPLNYIDLFSRIQIEEVLLEYQPTLIFVCHDETFGCNVATKVINLNENDLLLNCKK